VVEPLRDAAVCEKGALQMAELLVEEEVGLVQEADQRVGGGFGVLLFDIGLIGPIRPIVTSYLLW
jgi:hypothetical protein